MNFKLAAPGHSFKGAFAYYLHDKRQEGAGPRPDTSERVAWMEVLNLAHDDPAYVQSVMIATARNADALKKAAGVKATGRKATAGPVFAYSIQWHPTDETVPDRAGMMAAAEATLRVLGAQDHQAAIICHQDTAHPHVHIVVNRVHPETGKALHLHKNADALRDWAVEYERERGQIVSPERARKADARRQAEETRRDFAAATTLAAAHPAQPAFGAVAPAPAPAPPPPPGPAAKPERPKSRAAMLAEHQAAMKERHKEEWRQLAAANKARREGIRGERIDFKAIAAEHRAETRPLWVELGKAQAAERRAWRDREKRLGGIIKNAIDVIRGQQIRGVGDDLGFLAMCFNFVVSKEARRAAFDERQKDAKAQLAAQLSAGLVGKFDAAKGARAGKYADARTVYAADRLALIERQDGERGKVREAWKQLYAEREQAGEKRQGRAWGRPAAATNHQAHNPAQRTAAQSAKAAQAPADQLAGAKQPAPANDRKASWDRLDELGRASREAAMQLGRGRGLGPGQE
jgi:hypothetical protein